MTSIAAASLVLGGCAMGQQQEQAAATDAARAVAESSQSAQSAVTTRTYAPDPQALAAGAARSQTPMRMRLPSGEFQDITPTTITPTDPAAATAGSPQTYTDGATISVPANARAGSAPIYEVPPDVYAYDTYAPTYADPGYYVVDPGYATTYEYESLIRAGRSPSYSITTLHSPYYRPYSSYYTPYSPHVSFGLTYGKSSLYRYNAHNRPYSSGYHKSGYHGSGYRGSGYHGSRDHRSLGYDPLGGSLHRSAQLRFHEASRAPSAQTPTVRRDAGVRPSRGATGIREARPLRDLSSNRDRAPTRAASPSRSASPRRDAAPSRSASPGRSSGGPRRSPK